MRQRFETRNASTDGSPRGQIGAAAGVQTCNISKITSVVRNTAAGAVGTLTMGLTNCDYFLPLCVRIWFLDNAAPTTRRVAELQQVQIGACQQECNSAAPAVASTDIIGITDDYSATDDWCGVPVCWGIFTQPNLANREIFGFVNVDVAAGDFYATQWGNPCLAPPPGCFVGKSFVDHMNGG